MKRIKKFLSALFATVIVMSVFTAVPFTASAAVDNNESTATVSGDSGVENIDFNVPVLSIIPIPALPIDEVDVWFGMTVK